MDWKVVKAVMADGTKIINLWRLIVNDEWVANLFIVNDRLYAGTVKSVKRGKSGLLDIATFDMTIEQVTQAIRKVEDDDRPNKRNGRNQKPADPRVGCRLPSVTARNLSKSARSSQSV